MDKQLDVRDETIVIKVVGLALAKSVTVRANGTVYDILEAIRYKEGRL